MKNKAIVPAARHYHVARARILQLGECARKPARNLQAALTRKKKEKKHEPLCQL